ncbi:MAG: [FeFe] hydrogenase H-cluster radical SAM maturase HydE [Defluviitaleaceae bacterium]|nr:[FeFe] hydrogenase H-cluster radical SAM maturase HydE [Defluviitaleaceae bacterium]
MSKYNIQENSHSQLTNIIAENFAQPDPELFRLAREESLRHYKGRIFIRGLVEISNYCKNDCLYCGIRHGNHNLQRYRLTPEVILDCIQNGYALGLRSFVMQGGEDPGFPDHLMTDIIRGFRRKFHDASLTLSLGEKSREVYQAFFGAGADRYLLRHETAAKHHYNRLHPPGMSFDERVRCLYTLKEVGFQTGAGFMVGSPFQTPEDLAQDLLFLKELQPHMVGLGPFIAQDDTPFAAYTSGGARESLVMLALTRLMLPEAMLPATTALVTILAGDRKPIFDAGANVVMPNISPLSTRKLYNLYNGKLSTGAESAEGLRALAQQIHQAGYNPEFSRGDHIEYPHNQP